MALDTNLISYYKLDWNSTDSLWINNWTDTSMSYVSGKIWNAGSFNWSTSRIQFADTASLSITWNYTLSMWLNITALPTSWNFKSIICKYDQWANSWWYDFALYNNAGTQQVWMINASWWSSWWWYINYTFTTGSFVHAVVTYDGSNSILYVNTTNVWSIANTTNPANNTKLLNIGNFWYYTPSSWELWRYFNWIIDEIWLWDRVISWSEISQLYNGWSWLSYPFTSTWNSNFFMFF